MSQGRFENHLKAKYVDGKRVAYYTNDAVEQQRDGKPCREWYIKMGFAGYNSPANNGFGYKSQASAEKAILRYQGRSARA